MQDFGEKFTILEGSFSEIERLIANTQFNRPDGIVFDLGVCSTQLDEAERGFSFKSDGPLDMRMSKAGESAADIVNSMPEKELADIIFTYGDERASRRIARAISAKREEAPLLRTSELAQIVRSVLPRAKKGQSDPATRTFQALRIYVNNEIGELCDALLASERILPEGGILAVVSFHSLEDRIIKRFFSQRAGYAAQPSRHQPFQPDTEPTFRLLPRKPILPEISEIETNPRARSAKLRVGIRTSAPVQEARDAREIMMGRD
jgi:16S rRNA (cytosine1402-N4)-methyltransferase